MTLDIFKNFHDSSRPGNQSFKFHDCLNPAPMALFTGPEISEVKKFLIWALPTSFSISLLSFSYSCCSLCIISFCCSRCLILFSKFSLDLFFWFSFILRSAFCCFICSISRSISIKRARKAPSARTIQKYHHYAWIILDSNKILLLSESQLSSMWSTLEHQNVFIYLFIFGTSNMRTHLILWKKYTLSHRY